MEEKICIPARMGWAGLGELIARGQGTHRPVGPLILLDVTIAACPLQVCHRSQHDLCKAMGSREWVRKALLHNPRAGEYRAAMRP